MTSLDSKQALDAPPLTPAVFHILLALAGGQKHGYAIMKEVEADGGSFLRMGPGTLYGSLQRMTAAGLIEENEDAGEPDGDERRRYYQLTSAGRRALGGETARLQQALAAAKRKGVANPARIR